MADDETKTVLDDTNAAAVRLMLNKLADYDDAEVYEATAGRGPIAEVNRPAPSAGTGRARCPSWPLKSFRLTKVRGPFGPIWSGEEVVFVDDGDCRHLAPFARGLLLGDDGRRADLGIAFLPQARAPYPPVDMV